jgi:hypothetical protein
VLYVLISDKEILQWDNVRVRLPRISKRMHLENATMRSACHKLQLDRTRETS